MTPATFLAGNLTRMPREIAGGAGGVFRYTAGAKDPETARLGVAIPVDLGSGLRLIVGRDIEDQRRFADEMGTLYFLGLGFLSLTGLLAGFLISRFALRRIEAINVATRSIMDGDLTRRIPVSGTGDEFDVLATNFNAMLDRIEALMNGLREVSDNIAHDLKTPLTRLRNSAEAALMDPRGPQAYRDGLEHTIENADGLIKTFNALLLVARLEAGVLEENAERFDVGRLVRDVAELYEPVAEERGLAHRARRGGRDRYRRKPPARKPGRRQSHRQRDQVLDQGRGRRRADSACDDRDRLARARRCDRDRRGGPGPRHCRRRPRARPEALRATG